MLDNTQAPSGQEPGSQTDGQDPAEGQTGQNGTPAQPLTAEEVEAQWKHRVSQKDRAHAAAEQALRDENDALRRSIAAQQPRSQSSGQSAGGGNDPAVEALRQELEEQRRATEAEKQARVIEQRKAKYPALARGVGDAGNSIFTTADEATLAKLNSQYDDGSSGSGTFAPTAPRRAAQTPPKQLGEMSKAELEQELRKSVERGDLKRPE